MPFHKNLQSKFGSLIGSAQSALGNLAQKVKQVPTGFAPSLPQLPLKVDLSQIPQQVIQRVQQQITQPPLRIGQPFQAGPILPQLGQRLNQAPILGGIRQFNRQAFGPSFLERAQTGQVTPEELVLSFGPAGLAKVGPKVTQAILKPENFLVKNFGFLKQQYLQRFGHYISSDNAKELFTPAGYIPIKAKEFHEAASTLAKGVFKDLLKMRKDSGNNTVLFTSGGSGVGKTTALLENGVNIHNYPIVNDANLSNFSSAVKKITDSLKEGFGVDIQYIYRNPVSAWFEGVVKRAIRGERIVPLDVHLQLHQKSRETLLNLAKRFGDRITIKVINNELGRGQSQIVPIDFLKQKLYNEVDVKQQIIQQTIQRIQTGEIPQEIGQALLGSRINPRGAIPRVSGSLKTGIPQGLIPDQLKVNIPPSPPDQVIIAFSQIKGTLASLSKIPATSQKIVEIVQQHKQINKGIADLFRRGLVNADQIPEFQKWSYTNEDAARLIEKYATFGGKDLNRLSQWRKTLDTVLPKDLAAQIKPTTAGWINTFTNKLPLNVINVWRAALTSQLATAMRNIESTVGYFTLRVYEDALVGGAQTALGKLPPRQAFAPAIEDFAVIMNKFTPEKRKLFQKVLEENPLIKNKLYSTPISDITLTNTITNVLQVFNRTQEFAMRSPIFEAVLRGKLAWI